MTPKWLKIIGVICSVTLLGFVIMIILAPSASQKETITHGDDEEELSDRFIGYMTVGDDDNKEIYNDPENTQLSNSVNTTTPQHSITSGQSSFSKPSNHIYRAGESFDINGYNLTFGANYKLATITNQFYDQYGKSVIGVPLTEINNTSNPGTFNEFSINIYSSNGQELSWSVGALFDDSKVKAKKIMPGASQTSYLYFLYDGPGEYQIHIDNNQAYDMYAIVKINVN